MLFEDTACFSAGVFLSHERQLMKAMIPQTSAHATKNKANGCFWQNSQTAQIAPMIKTTVKVHRSRPPYFSSRSSAIARIASSSSGSGGGVVGEGLFTGSFVAVFSWWNKPGNKRKPSAGLSDKRRSQKPDKLPSQNSEVCRREIFRAEKSTQASR